MYHAILPELHHSTAKQFLQRLPQIIAASSSYQHLKPLSLFQDIAPLTLTALPPSLIASQLDISVQVARRRDNVIRLLLKAHAPALYQAVLILERNIPEPLHHQPNQFKHWITALLSTQSMPCQHCASLRTVRIGHRLNFRCRDCRRSFSPLKTYQLDKLSHCELWLPFIDKLLEGATCQEINRSLGINVTTAAKWQRYFLWLMRQQGFTSLADYCVSQRRRRYRQTWLDGQAGATFLPRGGSRLQLVCKRMTGCAGAGGREPAYYGLVGSPF